MDIYFIRHGETAFNKRHVHQPEDAPLNETGILQARKVAKQIHAVGPTRMISSTLTRAAQTADIINQSLKLPRTESLLFVEIRRPDYILGYSHFGLRSVWYMLRWFYGKKEIVNNNLLGESRLAFLQRIREAKKLLEAQPEDETVIVISHTIFIDFFVAHICSDKPVSIFKAIDLLLKIRRLKNTSVTHVTYDRHAPQHTCRWNLISLGQLSDTL